MVVSREVRGEMNYTINSSFICRQTGQLWPQIPSLPLTWGVVILFVCTDTALFLSFSFFLFPLFYYNFEGTFKIILQNKNLPWKENSCSPATQMGCWNWFNWLMLPMACADISLLQACSKREVALTRTGHNCLLGFVFLSFFSVNTRKYIGIMCP